MNVLLTDAKAPAAPTSIHHVADTTTTATATTATTTTTATDTDTGNKNFRSMMQNNLQPESTNELQLVESNKDLGEVVVASKLPSGGSLAPDFWLEHLTTSDTDVITEASLMTQADGDITKSELASNVVTFTSPGAHPDIKPQITGTTLPVVGETLPGNGNSLPVTIDQTKLTGPISNFRNNALKQTPQISAVMKNIAEGENGKGAAGDTAQFDSGSKLTNPDLFDSLTSKSFELNSLLQTASDSSSSRLQAAMSAINGMQNSSANPGTANPVASTSVLSNSLERMLVSNPKSSVEWGSGLGERVSLMLNQKQNAATIRLDPPMLGKMDIQIQVKDDVTNVTINTQHAQTRDMVDNASQRLREILQDAGYENVNVDVSHQSDQQKNDAQFMADSNSSENSDTGSTSSADEQAITTQVSISNSLVDYFA